MTPAQQRALAVALDGLREQGVEPADVVRALYDEATAARMLLAGEALSFSPAEVAAAPANDDGDQALAVIPGGRRCAVYRHWDDFWVGISPRNGSGASVEGPLEDWVEMARGILAVAAVSPPETPAGASTPQPPGETA